MSWAKYAGFHFATKVGLPAAAVTTDGNGSSIDRLTYAHMIATCNAVVTAGTCDINVQDSANGSTGWADFAPNVVFDNNKTGITTAAFPQITTTGIQKLDVDLSAAKRYIRFVKTTSSANMVLSVDVLLGQRDGTVPGASA